LIGSRGYLGSWLCQESTFLTWARKGHPLRFETEQRSLSTLSIVCF
jgi:hypothetical protein